MARKPISIASLPTRHGRVLAQAVWERKSYVLRLTGAPVALRALLIDVQAVTGTARLITIRPDVPIKKKAEFEPFYQAQCARWRVLRFGLFGDFAPGKPEAPPCSG